MRTAFITGANSGVGLELTKKLITEGWEVIALIRSDFGPDSIIDKAIESNQLRLYKADLGNYKSLKTALDVLKRTEKRIDVLFNNAGVSTGKQEYSVQNHEWHYEVNTVVPYIITMELTDLLKKGNGKTIINTSSNAMLTVKAFDLKMLEAPVGFKKLFGPYANSKLALSLWTKAIAGILKTDGIEIRSVCPGGNKTPLTSSEGMPLLLKFLAGFLFSHPSVGADKIYKAFSEFKGETGIFISKEKATSFKFAEEAPHILSAVDQIYRSLYV